MIKKINLVQKKHKSVKRNYLNRMLSNKVKCMDVSKKYNKHYWDGNRKYGYGGYKYITGYLEPLAKKIIRNFNLKKKSKILDLGCGKGFLIYEIKKLIPEIKVVGLDISKYAIKNAKKEIKNNIFFHDLRKKLKFKKNEFDLAFSLATFHNLDLVSLETAVKEISRVSKKQYIMVESYRNSKELFNMQCWSLTCDTFLKPLEWIWLLKKFNYKGSYEFIFFK